ncbi:hypothetical protein ACVW2K_003428 [Nocardioides sp. HB32]
MTQSTHHTGTPDRVNARRVSTETKAAVKTTELIAFILVTVAMLIASQIADNFDAQHAWFYASLLTIGYMISRGLAKSGSRDYYDDEEHREYAGTRR